MARTAGTWGTIRKKTRNLKHGKTTYYRAAYLNPKTAGAHEISKSFTTRHEAAGWLDRERRLVEAYNRGDAEWQPPVERERLKKLEEQQHETTYAEETVRFLETIKNKRQAESSQRKIRNDISHTLDSPWRDTPIINIQETDIERWITDHADIGAYALHNAVKALKRVFRLALREGIIERDPTRYVMTPRRPTQSQQSQIPIPTPQELQAILEAMPQTEQVAIAIAIGCGLRESEICALQRRDIDLRHHVLHVRHAISRGLGDKGELRIAPPKNNSAIRDIPLAETIETVIVQHLNTRPHELEAMVLTGSRSTILPPATLRAHFDKARLAAQRPDLHVHTLRAAFDTGLLHSGAQLPETMKLTGHSAATVEAIYQRSNSDTARNAVERHADAYLKRRTVDDIRHDIAETRIRLRELNQELRTVTHSPNEDERQHPRR